MYKRMMTITAAAGALAFSMPVAAQVQAGNLVNVNVSDVLTNVQVREVLSNNNVNVDALNNLTVQLPVSLATAVCGVSILGKTGPTTCTPQSNANAGNVNAVAKRIMQVAKRQAR